MTAQRLVRLAIDHADDVTVAGKRLTRGHCRGVLLSRYFRLSSHRVSGAQHQNRFIHLVQDGWNFVSIDTHVGIG